MRSPGRPRLDVEAEQVRVLLQEGLTKAAIARRLAVSRRTLYRRLADLARVPQLNLEVLHTTAADVPESATGCGAVEVVAAAGDAAGPAARPTSDGSTTHG